MGAQFACSAAPNPPRGQAWTFQDLITGQNVFKVQDDGGTGNGPAAQKGVTWGWLTDATGGFFRLNYANPGTFGLRYSISTTGLHEFCVQYDIRRSSNSCSKQCKTYGWGLMNGYPAVDTSNATFGTTMGGYSGTGYGVYHGDAATGSNDATVAYLTSGYPTGSLPTIGFGDAFTRTPYPTQSTTVAVNQDITGNVWETYMLYFRGSSPGSNDGQITIWKQNAGVWSMVMNMTLMWNCSATTQDRGGFGLGEFSSSSGFHEDYRNVFAMFAKPVGMGI